MASKIDYVLHESVMFFYFVTTLGGSSDELLLSVRVRGGDECKPHPHARHHNHVCTFSFNLFLWLFFGDLQYFIVKPHWMCTNVHRLLRFSSSLLLSEGTPTVPRLGIEPRIYQMAGRHANLWATPHPILSYASPQIELHLTPYLLIYLYLEEI